jgi:hypothetical protein
MINVLGFRETGVSHQLLLSFANMEEGVARVVVTLTKSDGGLLQASLGSGEWVKGILVEEYQWSFLHLLVIDAEGELLGVGTYTPTEDGQWRKKHAVDVALLLENVDHEEFMKKSRPGVLASLRAPYYALEWCDEEDDPTGHFYLTQQHVNDVLEELLGVTGYDCALDWEAFQYAHVPVFLLGPDANAKRRIRRFLSSKSENRYIGLDALLRELVRRSLFPEGLYSPYVVNERLPLPQKNPLFGERHGNVTLPENVLVDRS